MSKLNPQIKKITVGTRELREVTIYPLSMADQFGMTDIIVAVFKEFSTLGETASDVETVEKGISLIKDNLKTILSFILDKDENITFDELTNDQFTEIVNLIYDINYEGMLEKFKDLSEKVLKVFRSKRQLQTSSDTPPASD